MTDPHALIVLRITSPASPHGFHDGETCPPLSRHAGTSSTYAEGLRVKAICLSETNVGMGEYKVGCQLGFTSEGMAVIAV